MSRRIIDLSDDSYRFLSICECFLFLRFIFVMFPLLCLYLFVVSILYHVLGCVKADHRPFRINFNVDIFHQPMVFDGYLAKYRCTMHKFRLFSTNY